jgi:hypothetical protein
MPSTLADELLSPWHEETGVSEESKRVFNATRNARVHAAQPAFHRRKLDLCDEIFEIVADTRKAGWDGYDAAPITGEALQRALKLIQLLPDSAPYPDLAPSPEGEISFEWYRGDDRILSVTPKGNLLIYAAVLSSNRRQYGRAPVEEGWPDEILTIISKHFKND